MKCNLYNGFVLKFSIGIPAYNEEKNIGSLLENLTAQKFNNVQLVEIIVIVSGCTDNTLEIVKNFQRKNSRIKILQQKKREGKSAADTLFIQKAKSKILILSGADVFPKDDCLEKAVLLFNNKNIGVVGIRIVPLNDKNKFSGYFSYLWWKLFNEIAKKHFRAGEIILFRNVLEKVPSAIGSDEVYITDQVLSQGYQPKYLSSAVAYNMGPDNLHDILLMRRKHNWLTYQVIDYGLKKYFPKTLDNKEVLNFFFRELKRKPFKEIIFAFGCAFVEVFTRILARYDYHLTKKGYFLWPRGESTKNLFKKLKGNSEREVN